MRPWDQLREHYRREFAAAKKREPRLTQAIVAERGGLLKKDGTPAQGQISKLLGFAEYTLRLDTFLRAIDGLGLTLRDFVNRMDRQSQDTAVKPRPLNLEISLLLPDLTDARHLHVVPLRTLAEAIRIADARTPRVQRPPK